MRSLTILIPALALLNLGVGTTAHSHKPAVRSGVLHRAIAINERRQFHTADYSSSGPPPLGNGPSHFKSPGNHKDEAPRHSDGAVDSEHEWPRDDRAGYARDSLASRANCQSRSEVEAANAARSGGVSSGIVLGDSTEPAVDASRSEVAVKDVPVVCGSGDIRPKFDNILRGSGRPTVEVPQAKLQTTPKGAVEIPVISRFSPFSPLRNVRVGLTGGRQQGKGIRIFGGSLTPSVNKIQQKAGLVSSVPVISSSAKSQVGDIVSNSAEPAADILEQPVVAASATDKEGGNGAVVAVSKEGDTALTDLGNASDLLQSASSDAGDILDASDESPSASTAAVSATEHSVDVSGLDTVTGDPIDLTHGLSSDSADSSELNVLNPDQIVETDSNAAPLSQAEEVVSGDQPTALVSDTQDATDIVQKVAPKVLAVTSPEQTSDVAAQDDASSVAVKVPVSHAVSQPKVDTTATKDKLVTSKFPVEVSKDATSQPKSVLKVHKVSEPRVRVQKEISQPVVKVQRVSEPTEKAEKVSQPVVKALKGSESTVKVQKDFVSPTCLTYAERSKAKIVGKNGKVVVQGD